MTNEQKQHIRSAFEEALFAATDEALKKVQEEMGIENGDIHPMTAIKMTHGIAHLRDTMMEIIVQQSKEVK